MSLPHRPECNSKYTYGNNDMYIYPGYIYGWNDIEPTQENDKLIVKDTNGNLLAGDDNVTIIEDLKMKDSSSILRIGTKARNIHLVGGDHNIGYKIDGFNSIELESEFVKES